MGDITNDQLFSFSFMIFFGLAEGNVDGACTSAKFDISDCEYCGTDAGSSDESEVQGCGLRLVKVGEGGCEVG